MFLSMQARLSCVVCLRVILCEAVRVRGHVRVFGARGIVRADQAVGCGAMAGLPRCW